MSRYGMVWAPYVPVAERRRKAERLTVQLRKQGRTLAPVVIEGRAIATTFWGKAWCGNLEVYRDYESRLPRGRTYVRNGSVIDLQIAPGEVRALVNGSELYEIKVSIQPLPQPAWRRLCVDCAGRIDSVVELLQGRFSKAVMERLCRQDNGLFPRPAQIRFDCSCPDHASMCKHVAAVLYGVGARLDHQPELLFRLRAVDGAELVAGAAADLPLAAAAPAASRMLQEDDMAALFGLDMAAPATPSVVRPARSRARSSAAEPPPGPVAVTKPARGGAKTAASRGAGSRKAAVAATTSDVGVSRKTGAGTSASMAKPARKPGKTTAPAAVMAAAASQAPRAKAASQARSAEPVSPPPKAAIAGRTTSKIPKRQAPAAPQASGTSGAARPIAVRDRKNWSWKARVAARKAKKI